jgi:LysR family nitrogen assimilation transcriptional regulator
VTVGLPPSIGRLLTLSLIDRFRLQLPAARLAVVEGLSTHILEWITTGRVDVGLAYNPQPQPGLEITALLEEPLGLVSPAGKSRRGRAAPAPLPLPMKELSGYPLIVPERAHAMRRLLEAQSALAGVTLDIAWEVSSIPSIIDLVCAGHGHAVLTASGVAACARSDELSVRKLIDPTPLNVLCLVASSHKRPTPLSQRMVPLLSALARELPT